MDNNRKLYLKIGYTTNGFRTSSQRLGNTGRHNFNIKSIIRMVFFICGCWVEHTRHTENYSRISRQVEVRINSNIYLHWRLYKVLDEIKIIHLFINFRYSLCPPEVYSNIKNLAKLHFMLIHIWFHYGSEFRHCSPGLTVMVIIVML